MRSDAANADSLLMRRLDHVIPTVMSRSGIDAWVISAREYAEDPVLATMLPSTWLRTARRRTILVFTDFGRKRAAIARYPVGTAFPSAWDPAAEPDQWQALVDHLTAAAPTSIGINTSSTFPLADGLTASEHAALRAAMPAEMRSRLVGAEALALGWLETRLEEEARALADACAVAHSYLRRALSREVVTPGHTTTDDVTWWLRQAVSDAGLDVWFHPAVSLQRRGHDSGPIAGTLKPDTPIEPGDLIHIDFGIVAHGLHTDQQQHAYVLHDGEATPPAGLVEGMRVGNRLQDLLMSEMAAERSGNEILAATRRRAESEGIVATIYTHPIGLHGHAAGATIGLWDRQDGVPGQGDYPVFADTAWSIELSVGIEVAEWDGQSVRIMLEEDAFHDGTSVEFLDGRQTGLWLI